jgi:hypothetical protein
VQRKLAIGAVNDPLEVEADAMANRVMQGRSAVIPHPAPTAVNRKCACGGSGKPCASCEEENNKLQRKATAAITPTEAPPIVHDVLSSPGRPLDATTRSFMEPRFNYDFSRVRVHADASAAQSALQLNAAAYTVGPDIVFGADQYTPDTTRGRQLLAHELTHVVQQTSGGTRNIQRVPLASPRLSGNPRFENVSHNRDVIEFGDTGPEVRRIQQLLIDLGFLLSAHGADGRFFSETKTAVQAFQHAHSLVEDGRVGFATLAALDSEFPSVALPAAIGNPWSMSCVLSVLCPWNRNLVEHVLPTLHIVTFDSRTFPTERWDGTSWVPGTFTSGGFTNSSGLGFLNTATCEEMATTIYHEGWHAQQPSSLTGVVDTERDAYVNTEQWTIGMGLSGQTLDDPSGPQGLRTTRSGETVVDEPRTETLVRQNYGGVSSIAGERVIERVAASATDVRVMRPDGTLYVRPAHVGESVRGTVSMTGLSTIDPALWVCPP